MADYGEQFDEKLNHVNSLLREEPFGLETILPEGVPAEAIESGVFGGIDATTGIEWGQDKANTVSFLQSRNFATGSAGWRLDSDGNIEAESGEFRGTITATAGAIGGWNIVAGYIYSLQSGTPTSSPNDGLVMASGNEGIIVYENTEKRVELGYLSAGVYGLKLYEDDGSTVAIEFSDTQKYINGVNLGAATVASLATKIAIQGWSHD